MTSKPRRPRKTERAKPLSDATVDVRLTTPLMALDRAARQANRVWGFDWLPALVSAETAARYDRGIGLLNAAIEAQDVEQVAKLAKHLIAFLSAMDAEARAAGQPTADTDCVVGEVEGRKIAIMRDDRAWPAVKELLPDHDVYSLREAMLGIAKLRNAVVDEVKQEFPGAEIVAQKPKRAKLVEDEYAGF